MKPTLKIITLAAIAMALSICISRGAASAVVINGTTRDGFGAVKAMSIAVRPLDPVMFDDPFAQVPTAIATNSASNGTFSFTLLPGNYQITIGTTRPFFAFIPTNAVGPYNIGLVTTNGYVNIYSTNTSGFVTFEVATNIAAYQALIATNGLVISSVSPQTATNIAAYQALIATNRFRDSITTTNLYSVNITNSGNFHHHGGTAYFDDGIDMQGGSIVHGILYAQELTASNATIYPSAYNSIPLDVKANTGSSAFLVNSNGNAGIGTNNPSSRLTVTGAGAGSGKTFSTANSGGTETMVVLDNGFAGIGATNPVVSLQVSGVTSVGPMEMLRLEVIGNVADGRGPYLSFYAPNNSGSSRSVAAIYGSDDAAALNSGRLVFSTEDSGNVLRERMRIKSSGNVGVGTNAPANTLDVSGSIGTSTAPGGTHYIGNTTNINVMIAQPHTNQLQFVNGLLTGSIWGQDKFPYTVWQNGTSLGYTNLATAFASLTNNSKLTIEAGIHNVTAAYIPASSPNFMRDITSALPLAYVTNVVIEGNGNPTLYSTNYGNFITLLDTTNVTIRGISFLGNRAPIPTNTAQGGFFQSAMILFVGTNKQVLVENCSFTKFGNQGVSGLFTAGDHPYVTIRNNFFSYGGCTNDILTDGVWIGSWLDGAAISGIGSQWIIEGNRIENCLRGIELQPGSQSTAFPLTNIVIKGNTITPVMDAGIWAIGTAGLYNDIQILDNVLTGSDTVRTNSGAIGIWTYGGSNWVIRGNVIKGLGVKWSNAINTTGIKLFAADAPIRNFLIADNTIEDLGWSASGSTGWGIVVVDGTYKVENITITGNKISNFRKYAGTGINIGVYFGVNANISGVQVIGNTVYDLNSAANKYLSGINIHAGSNILVAANSCYDTISAVASKQLIHGLWIGTRATNVVVWANDFSRCKDVGVTNESFYGSPAIFDDAVAAPIFYGSGLGLSNISSSFTTNSVGGAPVVGYVPTIDAGGAVVWTGAGSGDVTAAQLVSSTNTGNYIIASGNLRLSDTNAVAAGVTNASAHQAKIATNSLAGSLSNLVSSSTGIFNTMLASNFSSSHFTNLQTFHHKGGTAVFDDGIDCIGLDSGAGNIVGDAAVVVGGNVTASNLILTAIQYNSVWVDAGAMLTNTIGVPSAGLYSPTNANNPPLDVWDFDDTAPETNYFKLRMPDAWNLGAVKLKLYHFNTVVYSSTSNVWSVAAAAFSSADNIDLNAFGASVSVTNAVSTSTNMLNIATTPAITVGGTPALGDMIIFRIRRVADSGWDNCSGDARLTGAALQWGETQTVTSIW